VSYAQNPSEKPKAKDSAQAYIGNSGYFADSKLLDLSLILPPPPAANSAVTASELAELHRIEATRTPEEVSRAQADDQEEDIFIFKSVMGSGFTAQVLPITAAFSAHVRKDGSANGGALKNLYRRPRPYQADPSLHPVCALNKEPTSYPSGHSLSGYLLAFALVQIVPERRDQIFARTDEYVHNRLVCGVHYPSDTEASRRVAYAVFGYMMASPRFQKELAAAREETRSRLGLSTTTSLQQ
jgi:acid phosphatase (class A)